jgi:predicted ATPase
MIPDVLDSITIQGFKSIASIEDLKLNPINVVIAANGSGKSNFIGAFDFLRAISERKLGEYVKRVDGAERLLHFGSKHTPEINFKVTFGSPVSRYEVGLSATASDDLFVSSEYVSGPSGRPTSLLGWQEGKEAAIGILQPGAIQPSSSFMPPLPPQAERVRRVLRHWRLYHVNDTSPSSGFFKTAKVNDNRFLRPDGANLAAFLHLLRKRNRDSCDFIVSTVQQVAPFLDD